MVSQAETAAELRLITTVLERLLQTSPTGHIRADQLDSIARRLRCAVNNLDSAGALPPLHSVTETPANPSVAATSACAPSPSRFGDKLRQVKPNKAKINRNDGRTCPLGPAASDVAAATPVAGATKAAEVKRESSKTAAVTNKDAHPRRAAKESSIRALPIARQTPPTNRLLVSKEVARVFTCTLYNVLESVASALEATTASIFVKVNDEMVSVANVAPRLSFPPKLNRHRCQDSLDAEVLGSGIAVNQAIHEPSTHSNSVLVFPVYPGGCYRTGRRHAMATVHVENKAGGKKFFDAVDESFLFFAAGIIGEIMSRVSMDWLENFFDPATQHVVAPFEPSRVSDFPLLQNAIRLPGDASDEAAADKHANLASRVDRFAEEVLVKRESLPHNLSKAAVSGLSVMPSLREVRNYIENVQDCWKRNVSSNVALMEDGRESQLEVRAIRRELERTQQRLAVCEEQLRLYQLDGSDYKQEYRDIKKELDTYIRKRDDVIM